MKSVRPRQENTRYLGIPTIEGRITAKSVHVSAIHKEALDLAGAGDTVLPCVLLTLNYGGAKHGKIKTQGAMLSKESAIALSQLLAQLADGLP